MLRLLKVILSIRAHRQEVIRAIPVKWVSVHGQDMYLNDGALWEEVWPNAHVFHSTPEQHGQHRPLTHRLLLLLHTMHPSFRLWNDRTDKQVCSLQKLGNTLHCFFWAFSISCSPTAQLLGFIERLCLLYSQKTLHTLMTQFRYVSRDKSAYSILRGVGLSGVASRPSWSSSCTTLRSTSGCWEMSYLHTQQAMWM
jgi:hypothetical protein